MRKLTIKHTDSRDGLVILAVKDDRGEDYEITLNSMDVASLMGSLRASVDEVLSHPLAESIGMPGMKRVQYVETPENVFFRVFLSDHLFHEYPVPVNTTLAAELKLFGDRVEARNLAKATHQPRDIPGRKN
jgi:hypothetical protein